MTITTNPSVTEPAVTELGTPHLQITQSWASGESRTIHVEYNGDLDDLLLRGTKACTGANGFTSTEADGYVVIALGVDGELDEVHYRAGYGSDGGLLDQAIASLTAARDALRRVRAVS